MYPQARWLQPSSDSSAATVTGLGASRAAGTTSWPVVTAPSPTRPARGGRRIPTATPRPRSPCPGVDVRLTIDRDVQFIAERAIRAKVDESAADSGTVVVMDPRTGECPRPGDVSRRSTRATHLAAGGGPGQPGGQRDLRAGQHQQGHDDGRGARTPAW